MAKDGRPERPHDIAPVFDALSLTEPLLTYSDEQHAQHYGKHASELAGAESPFKGPEKAYLYPTLAKNERARLDTVWYHTKGLEADPDTLTKMHDKVQILKTLIGWDYAICGILGSDTYERLVTAGLPLAILPRRESTCSHTVLQNPDEVYFIADMLHDWRFKESPHVSQGGLRSYAGAQLQCSTSSDEGVALGSLCIASDTAGMQLSTEQTDLLIKFASMLTDDILNASQRRRAKQQLKNDDLLKDAVTKLPHNLDEDAVLKLLNSVFPGHHIAVHSIAEDGSLDLNSHGPSIPCDRAKASRLWNDDAAIDRFLKTSNHHHSKLTGQIIRAVISKIQDRLSRRVLVVGTEDISHIYDDVDMRFVNSCALLLSNIAKEKSLQAALAAQDRFMRGITHHLRTPIHGILASAELLHSDLVVVSSKNDSILPSSATAWDSIDMIKESGRELMKYLNNMIRYSHWSDVAVTPRKSMVVTLDTFETQILQHIPWEIVKTQLKHTSVYFERKTTDSGLALVLADDTLIRDCLQPLLLNALQNTSQGSVLLTYDISPDYSAITFDVYDTGRGISQENQERIFEPYYQTHFGDEQPGLGLTIVRRAAETFDGAVTLVSTRLGSHAQFRATLRQQVFASSMPRTLIGPSLCHLPAYRYHVLDFGHTSPVINAFVRHLEHLGMQRSASVLGSVTIVAYDADRSMFEDRIVHSSGSSVRLALIPNRSDITDIQARHPDLLFFRCPFTSVRITEIVTTIDKACAVMTMQTTSDGQVSNGTAIVPVNLPVVNGGVLRSDRPRCLLVDDNTINLRIMSAFCGQRNFSYRTATDGSEAIAGYKQSSATEPITLVLLDLQMPHVDGIEACRAIRSFESSQGLPPAVIIIVTGQDTPKDRQDASNAGADDYFVKPLVLKALHATIEQYFDLG